MRRISKPHATSALAALPTPRHFELGGYETWPGTNFLEPEASVKMLDTLIEMAAKIAP